MKDMVQKGRSRTGNPRGNKDPKYGCPGEKHPLAKLTEAQVAEIRDRYVKGRSPSQAALAAEYGVTQTAVFYVVNRKNWKLIGHGSSR